MAADIIIYIAVVFGLLFWLRNTLGTRHEDEPSRPNPLAPHSSTEEKSRPPTEAANKDDPLDIIDVEAQDPQMLEMSGVDRVKLAGSDVEDGLAIIAKADRGFDVRSFVGAAQDAFVIIVEAFAKGDKETLRNLLQRDVYTAFEGAIIARENKGEIQETEIQAVRSIDIVEAKKHQDMAYITLRITAQEVSVTKDQDGQIISGDPDRLYDMTDRWTFGRNLRSKDPVWYLYETNDDEIEAHDSVNIPDAGGTADREKNKTAKTGSSAKSTQDKSAQTKSSQAKATKKNKESKKS